MEPPVFHLQMSCCQIASLGFCHGYTPWLQWQTPKRCIQSKSAAVAASADSFELSSQVGCCRSLQGSGGWWLVIALVGRHLGQAAAMTASKWHGGLEGAGPQNAGCPGGAAPRDSGCVWGCAAPSLKGIQACCAALSAGVQSDLATAQMSPLFKRPH